MLIWTNSVSVAAAGGAARSLGSGGCVACGCDRRPDTSEAVDALAVGLSWRRVPRVGVKRPLARSIGEVELSVR